MGSLFEAGPNWGAETARLKAAGYRLPGHLQGKVDLQRTAQVQVEGRGGVFDVSNARQTSDMMRRRAATNRGSAGFTRTASDLQMALPKIRQPLSSLMDKGIPFNINDPKELIELRRWCNTPDAPVWMADYTFKPIGDIEVGDKVIGWGTHEDIWGSGRRWLAPTTVLAVNRRMAPEVVKVTFASGRTVKCTPDHEWLRYYVPGPDGRILNGPEKSLTKRYDSEYAPLSVGSVARSVIVPTEPLTDIEKVKAASWLAGIIDGEGSVSKRTVRIVQSAKRNPDICARIDATLDLLGITHRRREVKRGDAARGTGVHGGDMVVWDFQRGGQQTEAARKNRQQIVDLLNWAKPTKFDAEWLDNSLLSKNFGEPDEVVSIESLGPGEVVSMQTTTGNYTAWGYASKNCRLFYSTHDLVPLLVDIYSKFPVTGLELQCKDPLIEKFYSEMFLNDLNYEEFLPDSIGREYFIAGEVTTLAHFNEELGIWSSEEVLNPDMVAVSKSLFVEEERVQLLVKDMVEALKNGGQHGTDSEERPSERLERNWQYQQLQKHYPEIIQAAQRDDGLDIADALVSRLVNKASPWDMRGTPHLLRSFRTLLMEESLNAAQDAVADRLYSPMILATMGIEDMGGDTGPWIPGQGELDNLRNDLQSAISADFKLLVHNLGVNITSVFGRESVPNFSDDYDRIDAKLMQAWGIGQALIMGGTGAGGTYASSAINREVCEQLMFGFQKKVLRHMRKRMEVIAEAQEHYDYEIKGGVRVPLYREIVEEDDETGERRIVRVPKLLLPDVSFATLNLRDETTERQFIMQLKGAGVPVSDKKLAINVEVDFEQELEREGEETVSKIMAKAQAMKKGQDLCDMQRLPYPPELAAHLEATLQLRQMMSQTEQLEDQTKMMAQQAAAASPAGQAGALPGSTPAPGMPGGPPMNEDQMAEFQDSGQYAPGGMAASGPVSGPGTMMMDPSMMAEDGQGEPAMNYSRPAESDEMRAGAPKAASATQRWAARVNGEGPSFVGKWGGPSSVGHRSRVTPEQVEAAVARRAVYARQGRNPRMSLLVKDPDFYRVTNSGGLRNQIESDWPAIRAGECEDSAKLLRDIAERYEDATGVSPIWDY